MFIKFYNVIAQFFQTAFVFIYWIVIGRWSKLNRLASKLEELKDEEVKLCDLLINLNNAYQEKSKQIRDNRQRIALKRLEILEKIGKLSVSESQPKSCEILQAPKISKKRKTFINKKSDKEGSVEGHLINGTNSYLDLLVEDTVQQFRETQSNDESMIRELYKDPTWKVMINDISQQYKLFSYLRTDCVLK